MNKNPTKAEAKKILSLRIDAQFHVVHAVELLGILHEYSEILMLKAEVLGNKSAEMRAKYLVRPLVHILLDACTRAGVSVDDVIELRRCRNAGSFASKANSGDGAFIDALMGALKTNRS